MHAVLYSTFYPYIQYFSTSECVCGCAIQIECNGLTIDCWLYSIHWLHLVDCCCCSYYCYYWHYAVLVYGIYICIQILCVFISGCVHVGVCVALHCWQICTISSNWSIKHAMKQTNCRKAHTPIHTIKHVFKYT